MQVVECKACFPNFKGECEKYENGEARLSRGKTAEEMSQ